MWLTISIRYLYLSCAVQIYFLKISYITLYLLYKKVLDFFCGQMARPVTKL